MANVNLKTIVVTLLILLSLTGIAVAQITSPAQQKKARETFLITSAQYLETKDRVKAREGYLKAIKLYPSYSQPRYNLAIFAETDENWAEALKWFTDYLRVDQKGAYASKARREIADYSKAIELSPKANAYHYRGWAKVDMNDLDGAIADYSKTIELNPKADIAYYDRGLAKAHKKDLEGAIADYTKAIELNPKNTMALKERENARMKANKP